jgi:hypothetical protein
MNDQLFNAAIIGAGPAGTGPLICAIQQNRSAALLDSGVALIERGNAVGRGALGDYVINSDTLSDTFLEPFKHAGSAVIDPVAQLPSAIAIRAYAGGPAPLSLAGRYMADLGDALRNLISANANSAVFGNTDAQYVEVQRDGTFVTHLLRDGAHQSVHARHLIFAMGASQSWQRIQHERILGSIQLKDYAAKTVTSHALLSTGSADVIKRQLDGVRNPRVVVIGGSHSALSAANVLLAQPALNFAPGSITIAHRNRLHLFYPSAEAALAEGYTDFGPDDICPLTKRLYRLSGFRFDSRELLMRIWNMAGRVSEQRVALYDLGQHSAPAALASKLAEADLIVAALGYRPNTLPIYRAEDGSPIPLRATLPGPEPLVNRQCELLQADGTPIANAFGIGLASGFVPDGDLGGEKSFRGQTNGLWLYQNGVGEVILNRLLAEVGVRS